MQRRNWIAATGAAIAGGSLMFNEVESAAAQGGLQSLAPSPRMPVLFLGHGSPLNAIQDNEFRRSWCCASRRTGSRAAGT